MPNQPKTPNRVVRIEDALWLPAKEAAASEGTTRSDVVREALRELVARHAEV